MPHFTVLARRSLIKYRLLSGPVATKDFDAIQQYFLFWFKEKIRKWLLRFFFTVTVISRQKLHLKEQRRIFGQKKLL